MEVYYNPPYTNGGIEKSTANLIGYEKTNELKPGESQTVTISFTAEDMASYDYLENGCYVLEAGVYWSSFLVTLCSEIMLYIETPLVSYSYSLNEVSHSCTS